MQVKKKYQRFEESGRQGIVNIQLTVYFLPTFESMFSFFSIIVWEIG